MARRRHAWQLDGVEQQFSMGAACLLSRPGARGSFRAQWLLGSVLNNASGLGCFLHAHLAREPACSRLCRAPLAVISVPIAPEPSLGVGLGKVLCLWRAGAGCLTSENFHRKNFHDPVSQAAREVP